MRAIVVGAGGTTRELLRRLGELWDVSVIDTDPLRFAAAEGIRKFDAIVGDGSSALVLRRAGLEEADALIAASDDDDLNLEAVRLAQEAGLLRVVAVAADPDRLPDYRGVDVPVYAPHQLTARHIEVMLEPRRVASTAFAQGRAEAIEFVVAPDSPVRGKRLRSLHSKTWVVAAVLREDELIIPQGSTRFEAGDRVTVVGAAADYAGIVNTFTSGESRFPLNFGRKVAVVLDTETDLEESVAEAISLVRNSQAEELMVVHRDLVAERDISRVETIERLLEQLETKADGVAIDVRPVTGSLPAALVRLAADESIGAIAVPAPTSRRRLGRLKVTRTINLYGKAGIPVLLCRSRHPYSSILVPARRTVSGEAAGRSAIDLANSSGATLVGVSVVPPTFVSGAEAVEDARISAAWLREEAAVQGVHVRRRVRRGNPVRVMDELAAGASLLVLTMPPLPMVPWRIGITGHLVQRVQSSILLVPTPE
jgi:Trk K+ transport system NAD-binding subunit